MKKRIWMLCLLLALLAAPSGGARPPEAGGGEFTPGSLPVTGDLRGADLRDMDLSEDGDALFAADFDTRTQWPSLLPEDFDPAALLELGKDPGLGLRDLHRKGITGKGVGIAIIDQTLLTGHREYADRLRFYEERDRGAPASAHGPAVASIALGETVGAAPEALLYFIASSLGAGGEDRDLTCYAQDMDRLLALNETLPEGEKIRVISMSVGWTEDTPGAKALEAAAARAREAGVAVVCVNSRDPLLEPWMGMGRSPYGGPDSLTDCRPGAFWEDLLYSGEYRGRTGSLPPGPHGPPDRSLPGGESEYAYFAEGGMSWAVPYVAGLYALACQVKPEVTFEEFLNAARDTARPVSVWKDGKEYPFGGAVDPKALLEALAA